MGVELVPRLVQYIVLRLQKIQISRRFRAILPQQREKVGFFVLVVQGRGLVEIAANLHYCLLRCRIHAVRGHMGGQGVKLAAKALYFIVAGQQHAHRFVKRGAGGIE